MAIVTGNYTRFNKDMSVREVSTHRMSIEIGDRVVFVDNSLIGDCLLNKTDNRSNRFPAGIGYRGDHGHNPLNGTVLRLNSVQEASNDGNHPLGPRIVQMPIVVLADDESVIYCNPINIRKV